MDESVSNSITGKIKHFAPLFDALIEEVGLVGAAVFGCIWRYCQMQRKVCDASKETIAERCGVSERTVIRWAQVLCEKGYLEDLTPNLRNKPHTYRDTGKIKLEMQVSAVTESQTTEPDEPEPGMTESHPAVTESQTGMTESQSHSDRKSEEETSKRPARDKEETNLPATAKPDPLTEVFERNVGSKLNSKPEGWGHVSDAVFAICIRVADLWCAGKLPTGRWTERVEKQRAGASELLGYHDGDLQATLTTLDGYHLRYEDSGAEFTVTGPQSLVNVIPPFMQSGGRKKRKRDLRRDGSEWTEAELAESATESLAEQPIDAEAFLEGEP